MSKYKNTLAVGLVLPSLGLEVEPNGVFEADADLTNLTGIVVVDDKKPAKTEASQIVEESTEA